MRVLILFILLAMLVSVEGVGGAAVGMAVGLGLDIPITLLTGASFAEIFTGWGLIDDVIMAMLRLQWTLSDRALLGITVEEAVHLAGEALDYWDDTDQQRRAYSRYLQRETPGKTYIYGDVTHRDVIELGISGGLLLYRRVPASVWQEGLEYFAEIL